MASTYNPAGIEALSADINSTIAQMEDTAQQLMAQASIIADGTEGAAADMHAELAQSQQATSAKAVETTNEVNRITAQALENALGADKNGAMMLGG